MSKISCVLPIFRCARIKPPSHVEITGRLLSESAGHSKCTSLLHPPPALLRPHPFRRLLRMLMLSFCSTLCKHPHILRWRQPRCETAAMTLRDTLLEHCNQLALVAVSSSTQSHPWNASAQITLNTCFKKRNTPQKAAASSTMMTTVAKCCLHPLPDTVPLAQKLGQV